MVGATTSADAESGGSSNDGVEAKAFLDKLELLAMLRAGDFDGLDRRLSTLQQRFEAEEISDEVVEAAFVAFANSDPTLQSPLDEWVDRMPLSYAALMARGMYGRHLGWSSRGALYAKDTKDTQFDRMKESFAPSVVDLKRAIELHGNLSVAYGMLISIAMATGRDDTISSLMEQGLELAPHSFAIRYRYLFSLLPWWGGSLAEIKDYVDGIEPLIADHPDLRVLGGFFDYAVADSLKRKGKYEKAFEFFERALEHGEHWWYRYQYGLGQARVEQYEAALKNYDLALQARPQVAEVIHSRAVIFGRDRFDEALAEWGRALELDPLEPRFLLRMAYVLRAAKRYDEALAALDKALVYGEFDALIWEIRGRLYLHNLKDYENAATNFKNAHDLDPTNTRYLYSLSFSQYKIHDCGIYDSVTKFAALCLVQEDCKKHETDWAHKVLLYQFLDVRCMLK